MPLSTLMHRSVANNTFGPFFASLLCIIFADSMMAYAFPVLVESVTHSTTMLGIIMALSSVAGITCDLLFPHVFHPGSWRKQLVLTGFIALFFPISTFLGLSFGFLGFLVAASMIWGIYYELLFFSQQNHVVSEVPRSNFSRIWSLLGFTLMFSTIIGPILADRLLDVRMSFFAVILILQCCSLTLSFLIRSRHSVPTEVSTETAGGLRSLHFWDEIQSWRILLPRVFPAVAVGILAKASDATMWTLGALFGHWLLSQNEVILFGVHLSPLWGWLPIVLYQLPMIFSSTLLLRLGLTEHKKLFSQLALLAAGTSLSSFFLFQNHPLLLLLLLPLTGFCVSLAQPLNQAVYSDLIKRARGFQEDLVGLSQSNGSLAYIITPIVVGILAERHGFIITFSLVGTTLAVVASFLLLVTPRKIQLPQTEMEQGSSS